MRSDGPLYPAIHPREYLATVVLIVAVLAVYFVVVPPAPDIPLNDDWAYAQSVEHLLNDGVFRVSDWASPSLLPQIYLGALVTRLTGSFSFVNLRWSTLLCGIICCVVFYDLLRQLSLRHTVSLLGVLLLLVNPLFVNLTYTFMSDIFFGALMLSSLSCYVRGFQRRKRTWLLAGSVLAAGAYLQRQLGVLLPVGVGFAWVWRERRFEWRSLLAISTLPAAATVGHQLWLQVVGESWATTMLAMGSTVDFITTPVSWIIIGIRVLWSMTYLGIFMLPALLAWVIGRRSLRSTRRRTLLFLAWLIVISITLAAFVATNHISMPQLADIINHGGLGALTLSGTKAELIPAGWMWLITLIAPVVGAAQATLWTEAIIRWRREGESLGAGLVFTSLALFLATILFAFFYDRYLLVLVPCAAYLVLRRVNLTQAGWLAAATISAAFMLYNLVGMSDYLGWTTERWTLAEQLVAQGVAPENIDGGFEWVGWHEFETALPIAQAKGLGGDMLAWMDINPKIYVVAYSKIPGYEVIEDASYPGWGGVGTGGHILVLRSIGY